MSDVTQLRIGEPVFYWPEKNMGVPVVGDDPLPGIVCSVGGPLGVVIAYYDAQGVPRRASSVHVVGAFDQGPGSNYARLLRAGEPETAPSESLQLPLDPPPATLGVNQPGLIGTPVTQEITPSEPDSTSSLATSLDSPTERPVAHKSPVPPSAPRASGSRHK